MGSSGWGNIVLGSCEASLNVLVISDMGHAAEMTLFALLTNHTSQSLHANFRCLSFESRSYSGQSLTFVCIGIIRAVGYTVA